jgi:hypothetical protein
MSITQVNTSPTPQQQQAKPAVEAPIQEESQAQSAAENGMGFGSPLSGNFPPSVVWSRLGPLQPKLTIGAPDDGYEREADSVADQVVQRLQQNPATESNTAAQPATSPLAQQSVAKPMALSAIPVFGRLSSAAKPTTASVHNGMAQAKCATCEKLQQEEQPEEEHAEHNHHVQRFSAAGADDDDNDGVPHNPQPIQRKCAKCAAEEEQHPVQAKANTGYGPHTQMLSARLANTKGQGVGLPQQQRLQLETAFGADFSKVRIHDQSTAAELARSINAQAFTHGPDIYFAPGKYNPHTPEGLRLLAHELTHTVQQGAVGFDGNMVARQVEEDTLQRACDDLSKEFDFTKFNASERRRFGRRVTECAAEKHSEIHVFGTTHPHPILTGDAWTHKWFTFHNMLDKGIKNWVNHHLNADETLAIANKKIKSDHLKAVKKMIVDNTVLAYGMIGETLAINTDAYTKIGDPSQPLWDEKSLKWLSSETKHMQADPEGWGQASIAIAIYRKLGIPIPNLDKSSIETQLATGKLKANSEGLDATLTGPDTQVYGSSGFYKMELKYDVDEMSAIAQVATAMFLPVEYTWELYDVTDQYELALDEQAELFAQNQLAAIKQETLPPQAQGPASAALEATQNKAASGLNIVTREDEDYARVQRLKENEIRDFHTSWDSIKNPFKGPEGTFASTIANNLVHEFNLYTTPISAAFTVLGETINRFAGIIGYQANQRTITFPKRTGWFMVRCVATPKPVKINGELAIRPSTVKVKFIHVQQIDAFARQQVSDLEDALEAQITNTENQLKFATDAKEREKLDAKLKGLNREKSGTVVEIIQAQIDELEKKKKQGTIRQQKTVQIQIDELIKHLGLAKARANDFFFGAGPKPVRPYAIFVSQETGQRYPLMLQFGQLYGKQYRYRYMLSDESSSDGGEYVGIDNSEKASPSVAARNAVADFQARCPYGRGTLVIKMPKGSYLDLGETTFDCQNSGGTIAIDRLNKVLTVLTVLSLFAVPYVGQVAMVAGAAIAAARLVSRLQDHTFKWDFDTINDLASILGAVFAGAAHIGKMRVARHAGYFALVGENADLPLILKGMQETSNALEVLEKIGNLGGFVMGLETNMIHIWDVLALEMAGKMSSAEAARQIADHISQMIKDGVFQFAGFGEVKGRDEMLAHGSTPEHDAANPKKQQQPGEIPGAKVEPQVLGAPSVAQVGNGADAAHGNNTAPKPKQYLPDATVDTHLNSLVRQVGPLGHELHKLLRSDHKVLERLIADKVRFNKQTAAAWNEIAQLHPMHADTYDVLLANSGLRKALIENPGARDALKHCKSPCFPPNATVANILALQKLIENYPKKNKGKRIDFKGLNDYLYAHRDLANLNEVITHLERDFDGSIARNKPNAFTMPAGFDSGPGKDSLSLQMVVKTLQQTDLPPALQSELVAAIHADLLKRIEASKTTSPNKPSEHPDTLIGGEMSLLNQVLAQRKALSGQKVADSTIHIDRILFALGDVSTHDFAKVLIERMAYQKDLMRPIIEGMSITELKSVHDKVLNLSSKENIQILNVLATRAEINTAKDLQDLINKSTHPDPAIQATYPAIKRLFELLSSKEAHSRAKLADVHKLIDAANTAYKEVAKGVFKMDLDVSKINPSKNLESNLKGLLHQKLLASEWGQEVARKLGTEKFGESIYKGTPDWAAFQTITAAMRAELKKFILSKLRKKVEAEAREYHELKPSDVLKPKQLDDYVEILMNNSLNSTRGNLFEAAVHNALERKYGSDSKPEYKLGVHVGSTHEHTVPDGTVLQRIGKFLKIKFLEYKTGKAKTSPGQEALRKLIEDPTRPDKMRHLDFSSPEASAIKAEIDAAIAKGMTVEFEYIVIRENIK